MPYIQAIHTNRIHTHRLYIHTCHTYRIYIHTSHTHVSYIQAIHTSHTHMPYTQAIYIHTCHTHRIHTCMPCIQATRAPGSPGCGTFPNTLSTRASLRSTSSLSYSSMNAGLRRTYVTQQPLAHNDGNKQGESAMRQRLRMPSICRSTH